MVRAPGPPGIGRGAGAPAGADGRGVAGRVAVVPGMPVVEVAAAVALGVTVAGAVVASGRSVALAVAVALVSADVDAAALAGPLVHAPASSVTTAAKAGRTAYPRVCRRPCMVSA